MSTIEPERQLRQELLESLADKLGPELVFMDKVEAERLAMIEIFSQKQDIKNLPREQNSQEHILTYASKLLAEKDPEAIDIYSRYAGGNYPLPIYNILTNEELAILIKNAHYYKIAMPWALEPKATSIYSVFQNYHNEKGDTLKALIADSWNRYKLPKFVIKFFASNPLGKISNALLFDKLKQNIVDILNQKGEDLDQFDQEAIATINNLTFTDINPNYRSHKKEIEIVTQADIMEPWAMSTAKSGQLLYNAILRAKNPEDLQLLKYESKTATISAEIKTTTTKTRNGNPVTSSKFIMQYKIKGSKSTQLDFVINNAPEVVAHAETVAQFWLWLLSCINNIKYRSGNKICFSLEDLIKPEVGMYTSLEAARQGINNAIPALEGLSIKGKVRWNNKTIDSNRDKQENQTYSKFAAIFQTIEQENNYYQFTLNPDINFSIFGQFYNFLPSNFFSYKGRQQAALYCIACETRKNENKKKVAEGKRVNISLRIIQALAGFPMEENCKNNNQHAIIKYPMIKLFTKDLANNNDYDIKLEANTSLPTSQFLDTGYISVLVKNTKAIEEAERIADTQTKLITEARAKAEKKAANTPKKEG